METRLASKPDGLRNRKVDARKQFDGVLLRTDEQGLTGGGDEQGEPGKKRFELQRVCLIMISDNRPALLVALRQLFRIKREKSGSLSTARARLLIRLRCLSSLNGSPPVA